MLLAWLVCWAAVPSDAEAQWEFGLDPLPYIIPPPPPGCRHTITVITISISFPSGHPKCGKAAGDPHLETFDGMRYDLQAAGEFVAVRSVDDDLDVQYRMEGLSGQSRVSFLTAVAARVGERRLVFNTRPDARVRIDGEVVNIPDGNMTFLTEDRDALLVAQDGYTVVWPDGSNLHVALYGRYLNAYFLAAEERDGRLVGIFGDGDGDPANDFRTRDGRLLDSPPAFRVLYDTFAESWRVRRAESLFHYESGETTDKFTDRSIPTGPAMLDDLPLADRARAEAACGAAGVTEPELLEECVIDVGFSGDEAFIASALHQQTPPELVVANRSAPASPGPDPTVSGLCRPEPAVTADASYRADAARTARYASAPPRVSGEELWRSAPGFRPGHDPLAVLDVVIAARRDRLAALDGETGDVVWEVRGASGRIAGRGLVAAGGAVFAAWAESLAAYDLEAGVECWRLPVGPATSATFSDGRLFVSVDEGETGYLAAVDATTGRMLWRRDAENRAPANWPNPTEPTVGGETVFVGDGRDILAVNERTGNLRWRTTTGDVSTGLAYADGVVYVPTRSRGLHALGAAAGEVLWKWTEPGILLDDWLAVSDELVYVGDQRHLHALDRTSGAEIWHIDGERNQRFGSPTLAADRLLTITQDGELLLIDAAAGTPVSRIQVSGPRTYGRSVPVPRGERLFFVLPDGTLNAYR